ncbi:uracil-DNA glycosylase-like [Zophobas morio]|uniref:uracil-DNA glycosylase-like n=1 Tax=Zophobas morio TaxID=2755281 RepID=UPI00308372D6
MPKLKISNYMNTDYRENFLYRPHKRLKTSTNSELRTEEDSGVEDILRTELAKTSLSIKIHVGQSWLKILNDEFSKPYFTRLQTFLEKERNEGFVVYPPNSEIFTWTKLCEYEKVKVVIIGQDPYHQPTQAHGLCFSVRRGVPPPPSLVNIYKELAADIEGFKNPGHGDLSGWARQGVLLLNSCLTVRQGQANSHKNKGWEKFTDAVIATLNSSERRLVFILWGGFAHKKGSKINKERHLVLQSAHPSPLAAFKGGFFGSKPFSKTNSFLMQNGEDPVNWKDLD